MIERGIEKMILRKRNKRGIEIGIERGIERGIEKRIETQDHLWKVRNFLRC